MSGRSRELVIFPGQVFSSVASKRIKPYIDNMPAIVNIASNLIFGSTMALVAQRSEAFRSSFINWVSLFLLAFEAILVTPVATYLFRFYPQWSMLYLFDPQVFPEIEQWIGALSFAAVALNFVAVMMGYAITRYGCLRSIKWLSLLPCILGVALIGGVLIFHPQRVIMIGDYDSFWQGNAVLLIKRAPGIIGCSLYLSAFIFVLWVQSRFGDRDPSLV